MKIDKNAYKKDAKFSSYLGQLFFDKSCCFILCLKKIVLTTFFFAAVR